MNSDRLDQRAIEKISGPRWNELRPAFEQISDTLLNVSKSVTGELIKIYIKYASPETNGQPFGVVWVKKASELIIGLSLPENVTHDKLVESPRGCKYAGLTKYIIIDVQNEVPTEFNEWVLSAFKNKARG